MRCAARRQPVARGARPRGSGNDELSGGEGNDHIYGDNIYAYANDEIEDGDDWIRGGAGNDQMWGDTAHAYSANDDVEGGEDHFVFVKGEDGGPSGRPAFDVIWDFDIDDDTLVLVGYTSANGGMIKSVGPATKTINMSTQSAPSTWVGP